MREILNNILRVTFVSDIQLKICASCLNIETLVVYPWQWLETRSVDKPLGQRPFITALLQEWEWVPLEIEPEIHLHKYLERGETSNLLLLLKVQV